MKKTLKKVFVILGIFLIICLTFQIITINKFRIHNWKVYKFVEKTESGVVRNDYCRIYVTTEPKYENQTYLFYTSTVGALLYLDSTTSYTPTADGNCE